MNPFAYERARDTAEAIAAGAAGARFLAGGTTLIDLMRIGVEQPPRLLDINALPLRAIEVNETGLVLGALARMSDVAAHPLLAQRYPVLVQALLEAASPQLRNMASLGGNLLQRTRCPYFRDVTAICNKREPGAGCAALAGLHRGHAIFGASSSCIAVHPSDLAVALVALQAVLRVCGPAGERALPIAELYRLPGATPQLEHTLASGELITAIEVSAAAHASRSCYLKVRDRASYEFAVVSVAAALEIDGAGVIRSARLAAGGVGSVPWRLGAAERELSGRPAGADAWQRAAQRAVEGAQPLPQNGFKVLLLQRTLQRALALLHRGEVEA